MFEDSFGHCRLRRLRRGAGQRRLRFAKSGVGFRAELLPQRPGEGLGARASVPKLDRRRCSPSERAHVVDSPAVPAGQSPYPRDCYIRASFFVVRFEKLVSLSNCINAGGEMILPQPMWLAANPTWLQSCPPQFAKQIASRPLLEVCSADSAGVSSPQ